MWVVKLGGSLAASPLLPVWLETLSGCGAGDVTIVPGGGPFADQVRGMQQRWRFSDRAAHHMALLSMEQYGRMMCDLCPALVPVSTMEDMVSVSKAARVGVWMPAAMALADNRLPHSWDLSADSLAAWLARRLGARGLLLVNAVAPTTEQASCAQLAAQGMVDPLFCGFVSEAPFATWICGPQDHRRLGPALEAGAGCGAAVRTPDAAASGADQEHRAV